MDSDSIIKELWKQIAIGIISSTIATIIIAIISKSVLLTLIAISVLAIAFLVISIIKLYKNNLFALKITSNPSVKIYNDCREAEELNIFVMKGDLFTKQDQVLHKLFEGINSHKTINFLMIDPQAQAVVKRAGEVNRFYTHLRNETEISLESVLMLKKTCPKLNVRVHNENAFIRFIYTNKVMYFSFFLPEQYSLTSPFYKVNSSSPIYKAYKKYFEDIFNNKSIGKDA